MKPKRINVTEQNDAAKIATYSRLTWPEQGEEVRRLNSILLSRVGSKIEAGKETPEDVATFIKCSDTAKKWTAEDRLSGDGRDARDLTDEEIERKRSGK